MRRPITLGLCAFLLATGAALCWPQKTLMYPTSREAAERAAAAYLTANSDVEPTSYEFNAPAIVYLLNGQSYVAMCGMVDVRRESTRRMAIVMFDPDDRDRVSSGSMNVDDLTEVLCGRIYRIANANGTLMP